MNTDQINEAFAKLIAQRGIHNQLGISSGDVRTMRNYLANGKNISLDKKTELLKKAGLLQNEKTYVLADLVSLLNFYKSTSQAARDEGPEYVIEKWQKQQG